MGYGNQPRKGKMNPDEAIGLIKSGQRIALSPVCAEPESLIKALVDAKDRLENVILYTMMPLGDCAYALPEMEGHFKVKTFSVGPRLMEAVNEGRAEYIPCHLSQIPGFFSSGTLPVDVALIHLSPPDSRGNCSLGVSVSYIRAVLDKAKTVIAQINEQMPRTLGDTLVPLSQVDYVVEASHPIPTIPASKIGEVEKRIAEYTADLIPDGAVVQVGIGNIADAILGELKGKKDLSIHTGTFSDAAIPLVESGAIGHGKGSDGGARLTATELIGSSKLYEFCDRNPFVAIRPIDYTHNISVLSQIKGLVSVTSGIEIDLGGQLNAEMRGQTLMNGLGGQLDFLRGAAASVGGKGMIAFPSTARKGAVSRIVSKLDSGISVSVGRADIDFVITEHGVARLYGKSLSERAKALISVAHPKFRDELKHAFRKTYT
ncbi:MAG: 4-hydroxybutyrate CoA-transferase [Proteobacteria bacterium]|nr:4-hydroxybutyrate CoA-transferase [Pseudomonadota bacterium]